MKKIMLCILSFYVASVQAIVISDLQHQTTDGQLFTHYLAGPASDGGAGVLTVHVRGDFFSGGQYGENYSSVIDLNLLGSGLSYDSAGVYGLTHHGYDDKEFYLDFLISGVQMSSIMADSLAVVMVDFGSGSNAFSSNYFSEVSLSYAEIQAIYEPAPWVLFCFGVIALGIARRKNNI